MMVETEWWKNEKPLPLNILETKDSKACQGKIPHGQKKELSSTLEATNLYIKQWNVNYQGLTRNPHSILEIMKVKLTHNQDQELTSFAQEHSSRYFPPS
jgi:hypothetical protein